MIYIMKTKYSEGDRLGLCMWDDGRMFVFYLEASLDVGG